AACELLLQTVPGGALPFGGLEVGDHRFDQRARTGVYLRLPERAATGKALLEQTPKTARLGHRDGNTRHHHAPQNELPLLGVKFDLSAIRLIPPFSPYLIYLQRGATHDEGITPQGGLTGAAQVLLFDGDVARHSRPVVVGAPHIVMTRPQSYEIN